MGQDEGGAKPERPATDATPERTGAIEIARNADEVFAFVADIRNLPAFLSGMRTAAPMGAGRVVAEGAQGGRRYHAEGWMRVDREALAMEWSTDPGSERSCAGTLRVVPLDGEGGLGSAAPRVRLELRIRLGERPTAGAAAGMRAQGRGQAGRTVEEAIAQALAAIQSLCEGAEAGRGANPRGLARIADAKLPPGSRAENAQPEEGRGEEEGRQDDSRPYGRSATMNPPDLG